jgi:two-component system, chemotaxis family, sensor kinase CheA
MDLSKYELIFTQESGRYLAELDDLLFRAETALRDTETWGEIHGKVHSIKGMARAMSMENISALCHRVESWCKSFQAGETEATPEALGIVEESIELLKLLVARRDAVDSAETRQWHSRTVARLEAGPEPIHPKENVSAPPESSKSVKVKTIDEVRVRYSLIEELLGLGQEIQMLEKTIPPLPDDGTQISIQSWIDHCMTLMKTFYFRLSHLRLMPVEDFMALFAHAVNQLARDAGKQVKLEITGGEIYSDVTLLERLREPLMHLLRNCIAHGIESPDRRRASGKPETGEIRVTARAHKEKFSLEISDDGKGIDPEPIRMFLRKNRKISEDRISEMTEEEILGVILEPDYTSLAETTEMAGRGVGMSVVSQAINHLGGSLAIQSRKGEGTRFSITMPLSLSIIYAITFRVKEFTFSIPTSEVAAIRGVTGKSREEVEAAIDLKRFMIAGAPGPDLYFHLIELKDPEKRDDTVDAQPSCVLAETIVGNRPLMVMPIGELLSRTGMYMGVGIMENGDVSLVLDIRKIQSMAT